MLYLVAWVGWGDKYNTWEPEEVLPRALLVAWGKRPCAAAASTKRGAASAAASSTASPRTREVTPKHARYRMVEEENDDDDVECGYWRCIDDPQMGGTCTRMRLG